MAEQAYSLFREDPSHPMLHGKIVPDVLLGEPEVFRVEIGRRYRAMALVTETKTTITYTWYWIGSHEAYNRRVGK